MTSPAILPINSPAETVISATKNGLSSAPRKQLVLHCRMMPPAQSQGTEMKSTVTGIAIGIAIGVGIGLAMGNLGAGIAIGIAIGIVIGSSIKKDDKEETHSD